MDYPQEGNFNYTVNWNKEKAFIEIIFTFFKTIDKTTLIATFNNPEYIISSSGKKLQNKNFKKDFPGHIAISKDVEEATGTLGSVGGQGGRAVAGSSVGILSVSSLFTNSLSCLSKLIQIIEFTGLIEFFNFEYDPILGSFLGKLSKMTEFDLIPFPVNDWVSDVRNSKASQWKGKLSETEINPYFLQELGYVGLIMLVRNINHSLI